jgi:hypothetical protein
VTRLEPGASDYSPRAHPPPRSGPGPVEPGPATEGDRDRVEPMSDQPGEVHVRVALFCAVLRPPIVVRRDSVVDPTIRATAVRPSGLNDVVRGVRHLDDKPLSRELVLIDGRELAQVMEVLSAFVQNVTTSNLEAPNRWTKPTGKAPVRPPRSRPVLAGAHAVARRRPQQLSGGGSCVQGTVGYSPPRPWESCGMGPQGQAAVPSGRAVNSACQASLLTPLN